MVIFLGMPVTPTIVPDAPIHTSVLVLKRAGAENETADLLNPSVNNSEAAIVYGKVQMLMQGCRPLFDASVKYPTSIIELLNRQNIASDNFFKAATAIIHMESYGFFAITYNRMITRCSVAVNGLFSVAALSDDITGAFDSLRGNLTGTRLFKKGCGRLQVSIWVAEN